jgi:hypothetical protein
LSQFEEMQVVDLRRLDDAFSTMWLNLADERSMPIPEGILSGRLVAQHGRGRNAVRNTFNR